jgi:hypothetical protein
MPLLKGDQEHEEKVETISDTSAAP